MDIGFVVLNIILSLALYILPYVIIRLIHRKPLSKKAAAIFTITWAILSAVLLICIKFKLGIPSSSSSRSLYWTAVFLGNGLGVDILVHKKKKKVKILPAAEAIASNDPYNVDDVEVNIVKPKYATTHTTDRKTKIALICMAIAIVLAIVSAGVAISKSAAYNRVVSEKAEVQSSLDDANNEYQALWDRYNQKLHDYSDLERKYTDLDRSYDSRAVLELSFYQRYAVCTNGGKYYHKYSCPRFDENKAFWIYNTEAAESDGFRPCPECIG